ncbi:hypothetical protein ACQKDS_18385 [Serratia sp. NPDC078593]|uniref:hypothetical protein n=1 Tax=unclassified Serratia (in: enterobacteria) TaxID=2647522 RepID=UPI0037CD44DA
MKKVPTRVIQSLFFAKDGETVEENYVKLQAGWFTSALSYNIETDGTHTISVAYDVYFLDLTDGEYYVASRALQPLSIPKQNGTVTCRHPFGNYPFDEYDALKAYTLPNGYPTVHSERPLD